MSYINHKYYKQETTSFPFTLGVRPILMSYSQNKNYKKSPDEYTYKISFLFPNRLFPYGYQNLHYLIRIPLFHKNDKWYIVFQTSILYKFSLIYDMKIACSLF